jgi:hypothetical protein
VRTLAGNFQLLQLAPWVLTPQNRVFFQLVSHKILRLFVPYLFISALVASLLLAGGSHFYAALASIQLLGILLAMISFQSRIPLLGRIGSPIGALLMLNAAAVVGLYRFLATRGPLWRIWDSNHTSGTPKTSVTVPPSVPIERQTHDDAQESPGVF